MQEFEPQRPSELLTRRPEALKAICRGIAASFSLQQGPAILAAFICFRASDVSLSYSEFCHSSLGGLLQTLGVVFAPS